MNVLLVEDDTALADVIVRNVRARGHHVTSVGTCQAALQSLSQAPADAMLVDVNLPDETGWELLRRIDPVKREALRVIVISASPLSPKRLAEFKPERWFIKPFPWDALMRALQGVPAEEIAEES
jgi:DNA-binding response OmpR family regulator